jgi:hypothetical protein
MKSLLNQRLAPWLASSALAASALCAGQAQASEGGTSFYLLGSGGPGAAISPPFKGVYFDNTAYYYEGRAGADKQFEIGGNVVANVEGKAAADFMTVLWVPSTNVLGGVLGLGVALPIGSSSVAVSGSITGPLGNQFGVTRSDTTFVVADPIGTASLGWKSGNWRYQFGALVNFPIGQYTEGGLANLAFHRWAGDTSAAVTWHDDASGWDVSAKAGVTFNGTNNSTHYTTGTEFHLEGAVEKTVAKVINLGVQAYYFDQITGDGGSGDRVGPFEGRVVGVGATAAHSFMWGKIPMTLRLRGMTEFEAKNRIQGNSVWLDLNFPLAVQLPTAPPRP